jgi:hypothetical protein
LRRLTCMVEWSSRNADRSIRAFIGIAKLRLGMVKTRAERGDCSG